MTQDFVLEFASTMTKLILIASVVGVPRIGATGKQHAVFIRGPLSYLPYRMHLHLKTRSIAFPNRNRLQPAPAPLRFFRVQLTNASASDEDSH